MKLLLSFFFSTVLLFSAREIKSQSINNNVLAIPLKSTNSVLFGKDIIINDQPGQDQRNVAICSAFNGWLYAVYSYPFEMSFNLAILRSIDNGITWDSLIDASISLSHSLINKLDILACGNSISNLKVFVGYNYFDTLVNAGSAYLMRFSGEPFIYEDELLHEWDYIKDFALASDYMYPASNSSPFSIGILYSKEGMKDSIIFRSSSNGGISLNNRRVVATSWHFFHKVALNYGRSLSYNTGRYYASWEEQQNQNSNLGHLYTAHSNPDFNSTFTIPVCIDSLDPNTINKVRNPSIACQFSGVDNDSLNLTEVVLFEKFLQATNSYDIIGCYNPQSTVTSHFTEFNLSGSLNNKIQPDINFNPYSSNFMVTYFDSTERKLPFLTNDFNMANPNSWQIVTTGYNDSANITSPFPKVKLDFEQQQGVNVWTNERTGGNGVAMFDAPYSTYTGISEINKTDEVRLFGAYPNPTNNFVTIGFELNGTEKVNISLFDLFGRNLAILTDKYYKSGIHELKTDISQVPSGTYIYKFQTSAYVASGKLIIVR